MDFFENLFESFLGTDRDRGRSVAKHVDANGNEYEWNWLTNCWEQKQGLFGPETDLDLLGNARVDQDWLGNPVADTNWLGERMHSSSGESLFRLTDESDED